MNQTMRISIEYTTNYSINEQQLYETNSMKQTVLYETESMRLRFFFHHMSNAMAMVQCAPTLVGSALRVVFGPQKSLLDNSRGAGGKNTAPTPHGHRHPFMFGARCLIVTDATCHVTSVTFHISERTSLIYRVLSFIEFSLFHGNLFRRVQNVP